MPVILTLDPMALEYAVLPAGLYPVHLPVCSHFAHSAVNFAPAGEALFCSQVLFLQAALFQPAGHCSWIWAACRMCCTVITCVFRALGKLIEGTDAQSPRRPWSLGWIVMTIKMMVLVVTLLSQAVWTSLLYSHGPYQYLELQGSFFHVAWTLLFRIGGGLLSDTLHIM